jgi:hypothetical protein
MKKLKVDFEDIAMIMDNQDRFASQYYLDTETGEVVAIPDELMSVIDEGESCEDLPDWELKLLPQAKEIFEGSKRYEEIPIRASHEAYEVMVEFASKVMDGRVRSHLESALHGKGAFRRFKDTLREYPEIEKQWFQFKAERDKEEVKDWLESIGIDLFFNHSGPERRAGEESYD